MLHLSCTSLPRPYTGQEQLSMLQIHRESKGDLNQSCYVGYVSEDID
jgi:hypothetical protein